MVHFYIWLRKKREELYSQKVSSIITWNFFQSCRDSNCTILNTILDKLFFTFRGLWTLSMTKYNFEVKTRRYIKPMARGFIRLYCSTSRALPFILILVFNSFIHCHCRPEQPRRLSGPCNRLFSDSFHPQVISCSPAVMISLIVTEMLLHTTCGRRNIYP